MRRGQKFKNRRNHRRSSQTKAVNFLRNVILTEKFIWKEAILRKRSEKRKKEKALPNGVETSYSGSSVQRQCVHTGQLKSYCSLLLIAKKHY